jgi:hypothetical protein
MKTSPLRKTAVRTGTAMAAAITLLLLVSVLMVGLSIFVASRTANVSSQQKADRAATSARSGAEIMLYVLQQIGATNKDPQLLTMPVLQASIKDALTNLEMTEITVTSDGTTITVSNALLSAPTSQSFSARITRSGADTVMADVTGMADDVARTMRIKYNFTTGVHLVFDPVGGAQGLAQS